MARRWLFIALLLVCAATQASTARRLGAAQLEETPSPLEAVPSESIVALADNGQTVNLRSGDRLFLALGKGCSWRVLAPSGETLEELPNMLAQIGCQGQYVARQAGHTQIVAIGEHACPGSGSTSEALLRQFVVNVIVQ